MNCEKTYRILKASIQANNKLVPSNSELSQDSPKDPYSSCRRRTSKQRPHSVVHVVHRTGSCKSRCICMYIYTFIYIYVRIYIHIINHPFEKVHVLLRPYPRIFSHPACRFCLAGVEGETRCDSMDVELSSNMTQRSQPVEPAPCSLKLLDTFGSFTFISGTRNT